jgi:plastocyanin
MKDADRRSGAIAEAIARFHTGQIGRRELLRIIGLLGLTGASAIMVVGRLGSGAGVRAAGGHAGHHSARLAALLQGDATPPAEGPPPVATPVLGMQADGTRVWRVQAGWFSPEDSAEAMAFLPKEITINAGDTIFFDNQGFHTVTFLSGAEMQPLLTSAPDAGSATPGVSQPEIVFDPAGIFPSGGPTYDGTGFVNSGVPLDPTAPPFTLTFTAPGTYEYLCLVHAQVMKGTVMVQEAGAALPMEQDGVDQAIADEAAAILGQTQALIDRYAAATPSATASGAMVHEVAAGVGEGELEVYRFVPDTLTIAAGDTVRWTNHATQDPHTATFLGGGEPPEDLVLVPQDAGPPIVGISPMTFLPAGGAVYNGQGYANSGYLWPEAPEGDPRLALDSPPLLTYELSFDTPGEYRYYCVLHGDIGAFEGMVGTITVTG